MKILTPLFLTLFFLWAPLSSASPKATEHIVTMEGMKFVPENLDVNTGDTVIWKNTDFVPHTVTNEGVWDSSTILPDKTYKHTFKKGGDYAYACRFHPTMKASIHVK